MFAHHLPIRYKYSHVMTTPPITIIGAGIAGLTAAYTLHQAGLTPRVLEASARVGGRVDSLYSKDGQSIADLGPTWVWPPFQPIIKRWLQTLELATFEQYDQGDAVLEGFAPTLRRQLLPGQYGMVRLVGGPQQLVKTLTEALPAGTIITQTPVHEISQSDDGSLQLQCGNGVIHTDCALIATPPRIAAERIKLPPALSVHVLSTLQAMPTWMAAQARAVIRYDKPFWRAHGLSGRIASREGPLFEAHDHTSAQGHASLFGFISTPAAQRDPATLSTAILAQLERCFGPQAAQPIELNIRDWATETWICSQTDRADTPAHPAVGPSLLRSAHLDGRLWFCGAETADQSPGLIEGALAAGEAAAKAVIARAQPLSKSPAGQYRPPVRPPSA